MHWLPPAHSTSVRLETGDYRAGSQFVIALGMASILFQTIVGALSLGSLLGIGAALVLATSCVRGLAGPDGALTMDRSTWFSGLVRAARRGAVAFLIATVLSLVLRSDIVGGLLFTAGLNAVILAPVCSIILMARMRAAQARRVPLSGEGGELEA